MSDPGSGEPQHDILVASTRLRGERHRKWLREGEVPVARRLAQIGVLGWVIVTPTLLAVFIGRWLDRHFGSGLFCTAPLMMLGLVAGCWSAFRWVKNA